MHQSPPFSAALSSSKSKKKKKHGSTTTQGASTMQQPPAQTQPPAAAPATTEAMAASSSSTPTDSPSSSASSSSSSSPASSSPLSDTVSPPPPAPSHEVVVPAPPTATAEQIAIVRALAEAKAKEEAEKQAAQEQAALEAKAKEAQKAVDELSATLDQIALYFYLHKPLTTNSETSTVSHVVGTVPVVSSLTDARAAVPFRYHGPDDIWKKNRDHYKRIVDALDRVDIDHPADFLKSLQAIDSIVNPTGYLYSAFSWVAPKVAVDAVDWLTPKTRFQSLIQQLNKHFQDVSRPAAQDTLNLLIKRAKESHTRTSAPKTGASLQSVEQYIAEGPVNPLFILASRKAEEAPENYKELDKALSSNPFLAPRATKLDCKMMISRLVLEEAFNEQGPAVIDVLHVLHRSLMMLKSLRENVGKPADLTEYQQQIERETAYLRGYLNPQNQHENASHLLEVLESLPKKCEDLKGLVKAHESNLAKDRYFDSALAEEYLNTLMRYAQQPTIHALIKGAQETAVNSLAEKKSAVFKH